MKLNHNFFTIATIALLASMASCQKVIQVHLNDTAARYVVEAEVTDQPGPYHVKVSQSVNFDQANTFPAISGATVVITDATAGLTDTLHESAPGIYQTSALAGVSGHTYQLYIKANGQVFTSLATLPAAVVIDTLYTQKSAFGDASELVPQYTDPGTIINYYHFAEIINDTVNDNIMIRSDKLENGMVVKRPINGRGGRLHQGDVVQIQLESIDSAMYQYYYSLNQVTDQNSATPANPQSNIKGGALGYFTAHTVSRKEIVVP